MPTMIEIQEAYMAKVMACTTGHVRRVKRGAHKAARLTLEQMGYTTEQAMQIIRDAQDMVVLEQTAGED